MITMTETTANEAPTAAPVPPLLPGGGVGAGVGEGVPQNGSRHVVHWHPDTAAHFVALQLLPSHDCVV
jgi:hypothetical protein